MAAGNYNYRLRRIVHSRGPNLNGQEEDIYTPSESYYWCRLELQGGRRGVDYGAVQTGFDLVIFVRNQPDLKAQDRLTDGITVYHLDSVVPHDDELECQAHAFDELGGV